MPTVSEPSSSSSVVDISTGQAYMITKPVLASPSTPKFGGGSGTGGMEPTTNWKDYVDAKDEACESRLTSKFDKLPTADTMRNNIWGAAIAIIATLLGILAFGGDRFDGGVGAGGLVSQMKVEQQATDKAQDAKLDLMDQKLDILIKQTASEPKS